MLAHKQIEKRGVKWLNNQFLRSNHANNLVCINNRITYLRNAMMKTIEYHFKVPTYLLPTIVNGDTESLTEDEHHTLFSLLVQESNLVDNNHGDRSNWSFKDEEYFSHTNDFDNLGGMVVDGTLTIFIEE